MPICRRRYEMPWMAIYSHVPTGFMLSGSFPLTPPFSFLILSLIGYILTLCTTIRMLSRTSKLGCQNFGWRRRAARRCRRMRSWAWRPTFMSALGCVGRNEPHPPNSQLPTHPPSPLSLPSLILAVPPPLTPPRKKNP